MDIVLIVFLTLLNGAFAMSELALASSRKARLNAMAEEGDKGASTALVIDICLGIVTLVVWLLLRPEVLKVR